VSKLDHLATLDDRVKELVKREPKARGYHLSLDVEMPGWKRNGIGGRVHHRTSFGDASGLLRFADSPKEAPILHLAGPWQVTLFGRPQLTVARETDMVLGIGTPGLGPGTTAWVDYEGVVPPNVYPTVEITYPSGRPGEPPLHERYELKRRC
jgi:hypothetical protein